MLLVFHVLRDFTHDKTVEKERHDSEKEDFCISQKTSRDFERKRKICRANIFFG